MRSAWTAEGDGANRSAEHVLVVCERSRNGRAALRWAAQAARAHDARLTVVALVRRERGDVGCGRSRQGAALWNERLAEIAAEQLTQARAVVGDGPSVRFEVVEEPAASAIALLAGRAAADLIVLPRHRLRWPMVPDLAARLRRLGDWSVVVVPQARSGGPERGRWLGPTALRWRHRLSAGRPGHPHRS